MSNHGKNGLTTSTSMWINFANDTWMSFWIRIHLWLLLGFSGINLREKCVPEYAVQFLDFPKNQSPIAWRLPYTD